MHWTQFIAGIVIGFFGAIWLIGILAACAQSREEDRLDAVHKDIEQWTKVSQVMGHGK